MQFLNEETEQEAIVTSIDRYLNSASFEDLVAA